MKVLRSQIRVHRPAKTIRLRKLKFYPAMRPSMRQSILP